MNSLAGKAIVISGVARGQGRSHAIELARRGAHIIGFDVCAPIDGLPYPLATEADLATTADIVTEAGGRMVAEVADVRSQAEIDRVIKRGMAEFGSIDGAVTNAAVWDLTSTVWEASEQMWSTVLDVSLSGAWRVIKAVAPYLVQKRAGSIVIVSSVNGLEPGFGYSSYVAAKHGLLGLMRNAALELAPHNVRCNAILPGAIDTRIWNNDMGYRMFGGTGAADRATAIDTVYGFSPLAGRSALPSSAVSKGVAWLLSDEAEHVTGTELVIDAGHMIQPGWNAAPQKTGAEAERYRPPAEAPE
jgi:SDR family mycofactocin-dependent oxidoreductase